MGWNAGYKEMEKLVVGAYDRGELTAESLDILMEPFKQSDCDSGGSENLKASDGLGVEEIICKTMNPVEYEDVIKHPQYYEDEEECWGANKKAYELFNCIWREMWGIW